MACTGAPNVAGPGAGRPCQSKQGHSPEFIMAAVVTSLPCCSLSCAVMQQCRRSTPMHCLHWHWLARCPPTCLTEVLSQCTGGSGTGVGTEVRSLTSCKPGSWFGGSGRRRWAGGAFVSVSTHGWRQSFQVFWDGTAGGPAGRRHAHASCGHVCQSRSHARPTSRFSLPLCVWRTVSSPLLLWPHVPRPLQQHIHSPTQSLTNRRHQVPNCWPPPLLRPDTNPEAEESRRKQGKDVPEDLPGPAGRHRPSLGARSPLPERPQALPGESGVPAAVVVLVCPTCFGGCVKGGRAEGAPVCSMGPAGGMRAW